MTTMKNCRRKLHKENKYGEIHSSLQHIMHLIGAEMVDKQKLSIPLPVLDFLNM